MTELEEQYLKASESTYSGWNVLGLDISTFIKLRYLDLIASTLHGLASYLCVNCVKNPRVTNTPSRHSDS